jgi:Protein of unknown function (DUF2804)
MQSITSAPSPQTLPFAAEAVPPGFERVFRHGRPRKSWRYVGLFDERLMACAASVRIGAARQSFWALWTPQAHGAPRERTRLRPRDSELALEPGRLRIRDRGVALDLELVEENGFAARCAHGRGEVWTRKQAGIVARGTLALDDEPPEAIELRAVIDDTVGYHARVTEWRWSAGVGIAADGRQVAWNLVSGVNDPPAGSERALWLDGLPHEVRSVSFADDLSSLTCEDGSRLEFQPLAERRRRDNLLIVSADYRAPFGSFSGELPGGIALASGYGVMEHHRARW